jgi:hypothetical protein
MFLKKKDEWLTNINIERVKDFSIIINQIENFIHQIFVDIAVKNIW